MQKLQERQSAFEKRELRTSDRKKWKEVLNADMMSSEESDPSDDNSMIVRSLPWRASLVDEFYDALDSQMQSGRSSQSIRQSKRRVQGGPSTRPQPSTVPKWACYSPEN